MMDASQLVAAVRDLADNAFVDLRFVEPSGTLAIPCRARNISRIRIELPGREFLHLAAVLIDADGIQDLTQVSDVALSSEWNGFPAPERRVLFESENYETAFHTGLEHRPWLEIAFNQPIDVSRIVVRNRDDATSIRARGIQVLVRQDVGCWLTIYDGIQREREFLRAVERLCSGGVPRSIPTLLRGRLARSSAPSIDASDADLARLLAAIELRDYGSAQRDLDQLELPPADVESVRQSVNKEILAERELEWTSHGMRRSFRFWPEKEREEYVAFAMGVVTALRGLTADVCFGFGSVLAAVRDRALIPHDDDLDLLIAFEPAQARTLQDGIRRVRQSLGAQGYKVSGNMTAHQWVARPGYPHKVDVFVGVFEGDRIAWYPGKRGSLTREMMFPPRHVSLLGQDCAVPRRPEEYLEEVYGPTWRTPDPGFRHAWGRDDYADIAR